MTATSPAGIKQLKHRLEPEKAARDPQILVLRHTPGNAGKPYAFVLLRYCLLTALWRPQVHLKSGVFRVGRAFGGAVYCLLCIQEKYTHGITHRDLAHVLQEIATYSTNFWAGTTLYSIA